MANQNVRTRVNVLNSEHTDYSRAYPWEIERTFSSATPVETQVTASSAATATIDLDNFTTIDHAVFETIEGTTSGTDYVLVQYKSNDNTTQTQRVIFGGAPLMLCDIDPAVNINLLGSVTTTKMRVAIFGT